MKSNDDRLGPPRRNRRVPYKIAVVDRSPTVRRAVQQAFPPPLFLTLAYARRDDFEDRGTEVPDAVLIGLSLPDKGGYALARGFKDRPGFKHVPLFLLRGAFERVDDRAIDGMDYEEIIREPFDSGRLQMTVRKSIDSRRDPESLPEDPDPPSGSDPLSCLEEKLKAWLREEIRGLELRLKHKLNDHVQKKANPDPPGKSNESSS